MRRERNNDQLRKIKVEKGWSKWAEGSAIVRWGDNIIYTTASLEKRVPHHLIRSNSGWLTSEYRMIPRATSDRKKRNENRINMDGRQVEISRLLGRVLRSCVDLTAFPKKTLWIDCDVVQADGGTRIASLLGGFISLVSALETMKVGGLFTQLPLKQKVAGVSVALSEGQVLLDPDYEEDSSADVDLNIIMNDSGRLVEVQGGAEGMTYTREQLNSAMDAAGPVIEEIFNLQKEILDI